MSKLTHIRTSSDNKLRVRELTRKLQLGTENVVARVALTYSLSKDRILSLDNIQNSSGKAYSQNVLFGNNTQYYIALICNQYDIHRSDKDIPRLIKMHIDDGLELIEEEVNDNPNLSGFEFLVNKIDDGLKSL